MALFECGGVLYDWAKWKLKLDGSPAKERPAGWL
jgi:hypothetical protein